MTDSELNEEWIYRYEERLGILCGTDTPTEEAQLIAKLEADKAVKELMAAKSS